MPAAGRRPTIVQAGRMPDYRERHHMPCRTDAKARYSLRSTTIFFQRSRPARQRGRTTSAAEAAPRKIRRRAAVACRRAGRRRGVRRDHRRLPGGRGGALRRQPRLPGERGVRPGGTSRARGVAAVPLTNPQSSLILGCERKFRNGLVAPGRAACREMRTRVRLDWIRCEPHFPPIRGCALPSIDGSYAVAKCQVVDDMRMLDRSRLRRHRLGPQPNTRDGRTIR